MMLMRLCRFSDPNPQFGFYFDETVVPLMGVAERAGINLDAVTSLLDLLPNGKFIDEIYEIQNRWHELSADALSVSTNAVQLLIPIEQPGKILCLAGNYAKHVQEGGELAEERQNTFPYVFMKPLTTLTHPGDPVCIPTISPDQIDWELELAIVIGKTCQRVTADDALNYVAGYTIVNDISDRGFRPNPDRIERPRDKFFDWQHGKWHDTFCPMGPCILPSNEVADPQAFPLELRVNDQVEQNSNTVEMVFSVAQTIEFISSFVILNPGDIIATGTPAGVGKAKGRFLKPSDQIDAKIAGIGVLSNPVKLGPSP